MKKINKYDKIWLEDFKEIKNLVNYQEQAWKALKMKIEGGILISCYGCKKIKVRRELIPILLSVEGSYSGKGGPTEFDSYIRKLDHFVFYCKDCHGLPIN